MVSNGAEVLKPKQDGITAVHMAASNNDIHLLDYIFNVCDNPKRAVNLQNDEGWTPAHMAGFLNNFDSLNLLIENGAEFGIKDKANLTFYEEVVRADNAELLECIYPLVEQFQS